MVWRRAGTREERGEDVLYRRIGQGHQGGRSEEVPRIEIVWMSGHVIAQRLFR